MIIRNDALLSQDYIEQLFQYRFPELQIKAIHPWQILTHQSIEQNDGVMYFGLITGNASSQVKLFDEIIDNPMRAETLVLFDSTEDISIQFIGWRITYEGYVNPNLYPDPVPAQIYKFESFDFITLNDNNFHLVHLLGESLLSVENSVGNLFTTDMQLVLPDPFTFDMFLYRDNLQHTEIPNTGSVSIDNTISIFCNVVNQPDPTTYHFTAIENYQSNLMIDGKNYFVPFNHTKFPSGYNITPKTGYGLTFFNEAHEYNIPPGVSSFIPNGVYSLNVNRWGIDIFTDTIDLH